MRKQVNYQDDGRVVAPMDVPAMPREEERRANSREAPELTLQERRAAARGLLGRFLLSALFCVGGFLLAALALYFLWLR